MTAPTRIVTIHYGRQAHADMPPARATGLHAVFAL
ncbi:hypothetical protein KOEU_11540 [Komagataeibacter europaeus]|uniref:Uncharacterized protein n=1 Tax=Komagataeibacter europaeus TaxID=33995 RepID=A0A0M0EJ78_KOMEU|nr:hypothetical protein KOEU_11540 [Komagataeibacter europaeus]